MPAMFGGRLWTTLTTWSLLIPAVGMGFAVQNPTSPYWIFLVLALLCGLGGGNFASSMANISFFFPKAEKGSALAINAGLGNLGVSVVQFVVPLAITAGVFGWLGGAPQTATQAGVTTTLWLQNAGFVFVPFIAASAFAAWFGMNDIATMKASFADQSVIFRRLHNWIMCWLYTGTFGSFIGFSAAFPLLSKILFPGVNALAYAFLGPLVGALARALAGKPCDRFRRGTDHSLGLRRHEHRNGGYPLRNRNEDRPDRFSGVLRELPVPLRGQWRGQRVDVPDDPGNHAQRSGPARARADRHGPRQAIRQGIGGHHWIYFGDRGVRGLLHPEKLWNVRSPPPAGAEFALYGFLAFYVSCIGITWWFYTRRGGLLFDVEHGGAKVLVPTAAAVK